MNVLLNRVLNPSGEKLNAERAQEAGKESEDGEKPGPGRGIWIKKLGNRSPNKCRVPTAPVRVKPRMRMSEVSSGSPEERRAPEMPDLESIIREFETGFLSPSKYDSCPDSSKQRNFVKKIVAAFEVKYKTYNEWKTEEESKEYLQNGRRESGNKEKSPGKKDSERTPEKSAAKSSPWRRSGIFHSPFKVSQPRERKSEDSFEGQRRLSVDETESGCESAGSEVSSTPTKSPGAIGIFSSPFASGKSASKDPNRRSGIYMTPVNPGRQDSGSVDLGSPSDPFAGYKFDKDDSRTGNTSSGYFSPLQSLDDTKSLNGTDWDSFPVPEETIPIDPNETMGLDGTLLKGTSMEPKGRLTEPNVASMTREDSGIGSLDKTPKIVGAFLKQPIECQDTSIDWIPITGKKLPRKKSLRKIFSLFTGKKAFERKTKLFSSERNLNGETREQQDSGYEEKSGSSSSLASLVSINEILLQQENTYAEPERRRALRTFHSARYPRRDREDEEDASRDAEERIRSSQPRKKLVLTEVPREEVKLDLGPSFPTSPDLVTMSLDRKTRVKQRESPTSQHMIPRIPKHPFLSSIPKHPFVSMTKMDEIQESPEPRTSSPKTVRNELYEVEFYRSCEEFSICHRSSSEESVYDVPRRFVSKSETEIPGASRSQAGKRQQDFASGFGYDVPRTHTLERPRSSIYEEAVSLKRRTNFLRGNSAPDFYASDTEPHYATIKPRNRKMYRTRDMFRSINDLSNIDESSTI